MIHTSKGSFSLKNIRYIRLAGEKSIQVSYEPGSNASIFANTGCADVAYFELATKEEAEHIMDETQSALKIREVPSENKEVDFKAAQKYFDEKMKESEE